MPDTLPVPDSLPKKDRQRVRQVNRNIRIRSAYPELRDKHGRRKAFRQLAQRHNLEPATIKAIVYKQR